MSSSVLVSLRVETTPEQAFETFTREIGTWWRPNTLFRFTSGGPGTLSFESGPGGRFIETQPDGTEFEIGRITAWEPGNRLAFTWRQAGFAPDQRTEVEVHFEPVDGATRVTVEHRGWDTIPQDHVARHGFPEAVFLQRTGEWWQHLLRSYEERGHRPFVPDIRAT